MKKVANELLLIAKSLLAADNDFKVERSTTERGAKVDTGTVSIDGKFWPAIRVLIPGRGGNIIVQTPRFKVGDVLAMRRGESRVVAEVSVERAAGQKMYRYTFADRSWGRDIVSLKGREWTEWLKKVGEEDAGSHQQKLNEQRQKHEMLLQQRRETKGGRLQELVDDGTIQRGMKVKYKGGSFGDFMTGEVRDFNFDTGKILLRDMNPLLNKSVWVDHIYDTDGHWVYGIT